MYDILHALAQKRWAEIWGYNSPYIKGNICILLHRVKKTGLCLGQDADRNSAYSHCPCWNNKDSWNSCCYCGDDNFSSKFKLNFHPKIYRTESSHEKHIKYKKNQLDSGVCYASEQYKVSRQIKCIQVEEDIDNLIPPSHCNCWWMDKIKPCCFCGWQ